MLDFDPSSVPLDYYYKTSCQRACLMAMIAAIMDAEEELTHTEIRNMILQAFDRAIDRGHMVGDIIDKEVLSRCVDFIDQASAVDSIKDYLKNS